MKITITDKVYDEERALYNLTDALVVNTKFSGPADGESALKEARNIEVRNSFFDLRYPLWHNLGFKLNNCELSVNTRAPLWYSFNGVIEKCSIKGPKTLRESGDIDITDTEINSEEFGWRCRNVTFNRVNADAVYFMFETENIKIEKMHFKGKYSFQYTKNVTVENSILDTKDAFWHAHNVTVKDSVVAGEYLGWYSDSLTFINCTISGTQPLCYAKNLKLINCTMEQTDLCFEYSDVQADIKGKIDSVKNPASGYINADSIGQIILADSVIPTDCVITTRE